MSARPSAHSASKADAEKRHVKRREEDQVKWDREVEYYKGCEKTSRKFDDWASPRYYDTNNQMIETLKKEQQQKDQLEGRREKLGKLLDEENRYKLPEAPKAGVPTEALKNIHLGIQLAEDERKRHGAELALDLEKQIDELHLKQKLSEVLQKEERAEANKLSELFNIEERHEAEGKFRENRELVLQNLKQHKMKLREKAAIVQEDLERQQNLIKNLLESDMAGRIEDESKRQGVKKAMMDFLKLAQEQQNLERQRQEHFDFVFDSEAKLVYEKQHQVWLEEEKARKAYLKDVMDTLKQQVDDNIQKKKLKQLEVEEEHQHTLRMLEEFDRDIKKGEEVEQQRKQELRRGLEEQIAEKKGRKKEEKIREQRQDDLDLKQRQRGYTQSQNFY